MDLRQILVLHFGLTSLRLEQIFVLRISGTGPKVASADRHVMVKAPVNHVQVRTHGAHNHPTTVLSCRQARGSAAVEPWTLRTS